MKRLKLRNPNIFISKTRICVRNIPVRVTDSDLRKLCIKQAADKNVRVTEVCAITDIENFILFFLCIANIESTHQQICINLLISDHKITAFCFIIHSPRQL